jgi:TRAP-type C4-dicarboxylate transport system substrate-binding protein
MRIVPRLRTAVSLGLIVTLSTLLGWSAPLPIKAGTLAPRGSSYFKHMAAMGESWRQAPGGGAMLTIFPDGTQGSESDMVRRMRIGQLQAGLISAAGLSEIEPSVGGVQFLPLMIRNYEELDYVSQQIYPKFEAKLREKGFEVLFWADAGFIYLFSKSRAMTPPEVKKLKMFSWAGSTQTVDMLKSSGFTPIPLESSDIVPSLQTGLIEAVPMPPYAALAAQVDGLAPHMLDIPWAPFIGAFVVRSATWQKLSPEAKDAMLRAAQKAGGAIQRDSRSELKQSIDAMQKRGLKRLAPTPDQYAQWQQAAESIYPKMRGTIVPADVFDEVLRIVTEFRSLKR